MSGSSRNYIQKVNKTLSFRGLRGLSPVWPTLSCLLLAGGLSVSRADTPADGAKDASKPVAPVQVARAQDMKKDDTKKDAKKDEKKEEKKADPAPAAPAPGTVTLSGLVDVYYGINFRAPKSGAFGTLTPSGEIIKADNAGHSFDINDREPSFSLGELNINRTEGKGVPFGITATLTFGDTARLVHANEPGGTSSWQTLQQLYATKTFSVKKKDITVDFGIFTTPFGYEVIESSSNDNYTRSFGFQYAVPLYHAGIRATVPLTSKVSLMGALVNGWNNVADDGDGKSGIVQLTWKPDSHFQGIFGFMGGSEGTGAYGVLLAPKDKTGINTYLYEFQPVYQVNSRFKVAGDLLYGTGSGYVPGAAGSHLHVSGDWLGIAGYARYQLTPQVAIAARLEQFEDTPGAGGTGLRLGGAYTKLTDFTLTLEKMYRNGHLVTRLEYRHDGASTPFYGAGAGFAKDQDTVTAGLVYKF